MVVLRGPGLVGRRGRHRSRRRPAWPRSTRSRSMPPRPAPAEVAAEFVRQAREILADEPKANGMVLRGFAGRPALPSYEELYGLQGRGDRRLPDVQGPGPAGRA